MKSEGTRERKHAMPSNDMTVILDCWCLMPEGVAPATATAILRIAAWPNEQLNNAMSGRILKTKKFQVSCKSRLKNLNHYFLLIHKVSRFGTGCMSTALGLLRLPSTNTFPHCCVPHQLSTAHSPWPLCPGWLLSAPFCCPHCCLAARFWFPHVGQLLASLQPAARTRLCWKSTRSQVSKLAISGSAM